MKLRLVLQSFNDQAINGASNIIREVSTQTDSKITGTISLPTRIKKYCVLSSPHIDKNAREQFELRLHKRFFDIHTNSTVFIDSLLNKELPFGVACGFEVLD